MIRRRDEAARLLARDTQHVSRIAPSGTSPAELDDAGRGPRRHVRRRRQTRPRQPRVTHQRVRDLRLRCTASASALRLRSYSLTAMPTITSRPRMTRNPSAAEPPLDVAGAPAGRWPGRGRLCAQAIRMSSRAPPYEGRMQQPGARRLVRHGLAARPRTMRVIIEGLGEDRALRTLVTGDRASLGGCMCRPPRARCSSATRQARRRPNRALLDHRRSAAASRAACGRHGRKHTARVRAGVRHARGPDRAPIAERAARSGGGPRSITSRETARAGRSSQDRPRVPVPAGGSSDAGPHRRFARVICDRFTTSCGSHCRCYTRRMMRRIAVLGAAPSLGGRGCSPRRVTT